MIETRDDDDDDNGDGKKEKRKRRSLSRANNKTLLLPKKCIHVDRIEINNIYYVCSYRSVHGIVLEKREGQITSSGNDKRKVDHTKCVP